jgi:hypothetical protein
MQRPSIPRHLPLPLKCRDNQFLHSRGEFDDPDPLPFDLMAPHARLVEQWTEALDASIEDAGKPKAV